jgi:hypothetical protein
MDGRGECSGLGFFRVDATKRARGEVGEGGGVSGEGDELGTVV